MESNKYTLLGIITIIIWGTSAAFTKNLSTGLGPYTAAAVVNLIGGAVVIVHQLVTNHGIRQYRGAPPKYWIICGSLFVIYTAASYISMEMVSTEAEIMTMVLKESQRMADSQCGCQPVRHHHCQNGRKHP